jgi:hypothetical protein
MVTYFHPFHGLKRIADCGEAFFLTLIIKGLGTRSSGFQFGWAFARSYVLAILGKVP